MGQCYEHYEQFLKEDLRKSSLTRKNLCCYAQLSAGTLCKDRALLSTPFMGFSALINKLYEVSYIDYVSIKIERRFVDIVSF
jgi:hypothetical protein